MRSSRYPTRSTGAHLLDTQADQNIGNSTVLQPEGGVGGTIVPQTAVGSSYNRIIDLTGPSKTAQTTSVVLTATRLLPGTDNPNPGWAGPVTAILEFGNGGRSTRVEVDVPIGPFVGAFQGTTATLDPQDGGTIVSVPTGVLRVYGRYDNRLIQPGLSSPSRAIAQVVGVPFMGPGGPIVPPAPAPFVAPAEPVLFKAMVSYYTRHFTRAYKTQFLYATQVGSPPIQIQALDSTLFTVPPFAQSVQVQRYPVSSAMILETWTGLSNQPCNQYAIPTMQSPVIPIVGHEHIVRISSATAADTVSFLALCYEIGV